jgi:type VI secretion system ImpM family protein
LPIYGDFIRFNAEISEVHRLDQWFQQGICVARQRLGASWEEDFEKADAWCFVFRVDDTKNYLVGVYTPSRDHSGRQYPFFVYYRIEERLVNGWCHLLPIALASFFAQSAAIARTGWAGLSLEAFLLVVPQIQFSKEPEWRSAEERYVQRLSERSTQEFWTDLFGEFEHPRKYRLYQRLVDVLQPVRRSSPTAVSLGLKFPLLDLKEDENWDLALWLDLIEQLGSRRHPVSAFLWNRLAGQNAPCAMVFLGDPSPQSVVFLVHPELEGDTWYDLAPEESSGLVEAKRDLRSDRRVLLERGDLSLTGFFEAAR